MGYYSDVAIAMYKKDFEKMCEKAKQHESKYVYEFVMDGYKKAPQGKPDDEYVYLYWERVKWYPVYTEINFVKNFLFGKEVCYDLVRIGEDYNDTECIFKSDEYLLGITRQIEFCNL